MQKSLGKCHKLKIIGFVFTKETLGARVELSGDQLQVYDQPETDAERNISKRQYGKPTRVPSSIDAAVGANADADVVTSLEAVDAVQASNPFYPIPGLGKRAHITLGTSEGVRPVNTGIDVLEAVHHEKLASAGKFEPETHTLPGSTSVLRRYGPSMWVLYPDKHYMVDSLFTGHY